MGKKTSLQKLVLKDFRVISKGNKTHLSDLITSCKKLTSLSILHPELPSVLTEDFNIPKQLDAIFNAKSKFTEVMLSKSLIDRALPLDMFNKKLKPASLTIANKNIQKLSIQNIKMPGELLKNLLKSLICRLCDVKLENVDMNDALANTAADAIGYSNTIKSLSFAENTGIGIRGAIAILAALKENKGLSSLDLRRISLTRENKKTLYSKKENLISTARIFL
eukprot:TRINITY_DN1773_c0_g6_i1.p1 TRINITY_DN1773_c0_g6~~TRINITY_DN1773_c0_g6_i1.p1  ORF type:complete len:222 (-),score=42.34 TRINITY_DN1773_c0_g6_i1:93-758(-)